MFVRVSEGIVTARAWAYYADDDLELKVDDVVLVYLKNKHVLGVVQEVFTSRYEMIDAMYDGRIPSFQGPEYYRPVIVKANREERKAFRRVVKLMSQLEVASDHLRDLTYNLESQIIRSSEGPWSHASADGEF